MTRTAGGKAAPKRREDPLDWLARRTGPDGAPLVGQAQMAAAERLQADYERACWSAPVTSDWTRVAQNHSRAMGGAATAPESARAAQRRVTAALDDVGSGLAEALVSVLFQSRGLEETEAALGWPKRAGKVVLLMALERLAVHYGMMRPPPAIAAWRGARPEMFPEG